MKKNKIKKELEEMNMNVIKTIDSMIDNFDIRIINDNGKFSVDTNNQNMDIDYLITILTTVIELTLIDKEFTEVTEQLLKNSLEQIYRILKLRELGAFDEK